MSTIRKAIARIAPALAIAAALAGGAGRWG
jgi:hypothetical protein